MDLIHSPQTLQLPAHPALVWTPHPLRSEGREFVYAVLTPGETIYSYLHRTRILERMGNQLFMLTVDGRRVPRDMWKYCRPKQGTLINLYASLGSSGGGGGRQKNPFAIVAMIILIIVTQGAGYAAWAAEAGAALGVSAGLVTAGVVALGGLAINRIFPPPKPDAVERAREESPTFSLSGGTNRLRRFEPMPRVVGTHRMIPDLGAIPYTEFEGEDQFLYQVFDFGYNDLVLSDFRIGQNSIDGFTGVVLEESGADGKLFTFPANVDSQEGAALPLAGPFVVRTTSINTTTIGVDLTGVQFGVMDDGAALLMASVFEINYRLVGTTPWIPITLESDASPIIITGGGGSGIRIDMLSQALAPFGPLPSGGYRIVTLDRKPIRRSLKWNVVQGQYEVRIRKTLGPITDSTKQVSDIIWSQLKSYQPDAANYTGRKRVAVKIRASGQLSGPIEQFNCIVQAKTQVWNGSAFVQQVTSNPAWWFLDAARGKFVSTTRVWGAGLTDGKIDIAGLKAFAVWCDAQGLTVNFVFDQQQSVFDVLSTLALNGRATPSYGTGKLGVVWDAPNLPITALFGMHNIVAGTFEINYTSEDLAEIIEGEFINPALDWQRDTVRATVPGATGTAKVRRIQLVGRTSQALAAQDTNLYAAANAYRTRHYKWQSDWEAMPCSRGDVIGLTHDLSSLNYSGRFVEGGSATTLKLPKKVPLFSGGAFINVQKPDGTFASYGVLGGIGESDTLTASPPLPFNPWVDVNHPPYDYRWQYGPTATPGKKVKIDSFRPISERLVEISSVDEVPEYYASKDNTFTFTPSRPGFGQVSIEAIVLQEDGIRVGNSYLVRVNITWRVSGDYGFANVRALVDGRDPVTIGGDIRSSSTYYDIPDFTFLTIEVTVYSSLGRLGKSSKLSFSKAINFANITDPANVSGFTGVVIPSGIRLNWNQNVDADVSEYELWLGTSFGVGTKLFRGNALEYIDQPKLNGTYNYHIKAFDTADRSSLSSSTVNVTINAITAPTVSVVINETDAVLNWVAPVLQQALDTYEVRWGTDFASGTSLGKTKATTFKTPITWTGSRTFWVAATDIGGQTGAAGSVALNVLAAPAPTFNLPVIAGEDVILSWNAPVGGSLPIREYEIRYGASFGAGTFITRIKGTTHTFRVAWGGDRTFWVAAVDSNNVVGASVSVTVTITIPGEVEITSLVIDNNVLLQWTDGKRTLPIKHYEIRRGNVFASAVVVGTILARFSALFEPLAGVYKYWIAGVDTADNIGMERSITSTVNQPPDFVLYSANVSQLDSTNRSNWLRQQGNHYMLDLDGSTQYGTVAINPSAWTAATLEFWVRSDAAAANKGVGGWWDGVDGFYLQSKSTSTDGFLVQAGLVNDTAEVSIDTISGPRHAMMIFDGSLTGNANRLKLYVDGVQQSLTFNGAAAIPAALGTISGNFELGRIPVLNRYWDGKVGPARIYQRALSSTEAAEHYHGIFKTETNIIAAWDQDEGTGGISHDDTDNTNDLALQSAPPWIASTLDGRDDLSLGSPKVYYPYKEAESVTEYQTRTGFANGQDAAEQKLSEPGTSANYTDTPDTAGNSVTSSIEIRWKGAMNDYTPAAETTLVAKWTPTGNNKSYKLNVTTGGNLKLYLSQDGTAELSAASSVATGITDGHVREFKVNWDNTSDVVTYAISDDDGQTFTALGTNQSIVATGIFNSTAVLEVGANSVGTAELLAGKTHRAEVRSGVGGSIVAKFNANDWVSGTTITSSATGEVWTLRGTASILPGNPGPLYPAPSTAQYIEVIDLGTTIAAAKITLTLNDSALLGSVTVTPKISVKLNIGDAYTDFAGVFTAFTTNFRYIKITLDVTSAGGNHARVATQLSANLDVKQISDAGLVACVAGDAGGTQVNFNIAFKDVTSITLTPKGTTALTAVYDFVDAPNPVGFKALLFNSVTGARVSADASWNAKGV